MAPSGKSSVSRRKAAGGKGLHVTLHVSPDKLKEVLEPTETTGAKEETPLKEDPDTQDKLDGKTTKASSDSPASEAPQAAITASGENVSDSNPATPANGNGTPTPSVMGPPGEAGKKKGTKRSAGAVNGVGPDGQPKVRGKPGPKKKARLEDGTIDPNAAGKSGAAAHKLGPKANQGAINAGLRALDRSGAPCRKWQKGGFRMKSFTGIVWEIPRWKAPPKIDSQAPSEDSAAASAENSSSKENNQPGKEGKDVKETNGHLKSDVNSAVAISGANSNADGDVEMRSGPGSAVAASSPAPTPVPAAS